MGTGTAGQNPRTSTRSCTIARGKMGLYHGAAASVRGGGEIQRREGGGSTRKGNVHELGKGEKAVCLWKNGKVRKGPRGKRELVGYKRENRDSRKKEKRPGSKVNDKKNQLIRLRKINNTRGRGGRPSV